MKRTIKTHPLLERKKKFNELRDREKWKEWEQYKNGPWMCGQCGTVLDDGPRNASPFSGSSLHCNNCNYELTYRTGGGQSDPFGWILDTRSIIERIAAAEENEETLRKKIKGEDSSFTWNDLIEDLKHLPKEMLDKTVCINNGGSETFGSVGEIDKQGNYYIKGY